MITPANVLGETLGKSKITKDEIDEISNIFLDAKTSAKILQEQADKYISWATSPSSNLFICWEEIFSEKYSQKSQNTRDIAA